MSLAVILNSPALKIAGAILVPNIGGILNGTLVTRPNLQWFNTLQKPAGNPPAWLFGPVWTSLYAAMGYASYLVWRAGAGEAASGAVATTPRDLWLAALGLYGAQMVANQAWTPVFFGRHDLKSSFYLILGLDALAIATTALFFKIDRTAGWLLVPYLAWLSYASYLNGALLRLNPDNKADGWTSSAVRGEKLE